MSLLAFLRRVVASARGQTVGIVALLRIRKTFLVAGYQARAGGGQNLAGRRQSIRFGGGASTGRLGRVWRSFSPAWEGHACVVGADYGAPPRDLVGARVAAAQDFPVGASFLGALVRFVKARVVEVARPFLSRSNVERVHVGSRFVVY